MPAQIIGKHYTVVQCNVVTAFQSIAQNICIVLTIHLYVHNNNSNNNNSNILTLSLKSSVLSLDIVNIIHCKLFSNIGLAKLATRNSTHAATGSIRAAISCKYKSLDTGTRYRKSYL